MTITIEVPEETATRLAALSPADRTRFDEAMRQVATTIVFASATNLSATEATAVPDISLPAQDHPLTWEELTGFSEEEEASFNQNLGQHTAEMAEPTLAQRWNDDAEQKAATQIEVETQ